MFKVLVIVLKNRKCIYEASYVTVWSWTCITMTNDFGHSDSLPSGDVCIFCISVHVLVNVCNTCIDYLTLSIHDNIFYTNSSLCQSSTTTDLICIWSKEKPTLTKNTTFLVLCLSAIVLLLSHSLCCCLLRSLTVFGDETQKFPKACVRLVQRIYQYNILWHFRRRRHFVGQVFWIIHQQPFALLALSETKRSCTDLTCQTIWLLVMYCIILILLSWKIRYLLFCCT